MSYTSQLPPHMFVLEGIFLGYLDAKKKKVIIEVEQEQCIIKLPKEVRAALQSYQLQPGERIRCIGRSQVDFKTGAIKLKAYQVLRLAQADEDQQPAPLTPISTIVPSPRTSTNPAVSSKKQVKFLVCRKSGCQKRGGRQLVATLEKLLQEYQLQDQIAIQYTGCQKRCSKAPTLTIMPGKHRYDRLTPKAIRGLIEKYAISPNPVSHQSYENKIPPAIS